MRASKRLYSCMSCIVCVCALSYSIACVHKHQRQQKTDLIVHSFLRERFSRIWLGERTVDSLSLCFRTGWKRAIHYFQREYRAYELLLVAFFCLAVWSRKQIIGTVCIVLWAERKGESACVRLSNRNLARVSVSHKRRQTASPSWVCIPHSTGDSLQSTSTIFWKQYHRVEFRDKFPKPTNADNTRPTPNSSI